MNMPFRLLALVAAIASTPWAQATDISAGTSEYVTIRNCSVVGASGCDGLSPVIFGQYGGLPGDAASSANIAAPGYGSADGSVALSGVVGAPVLRAGAVSEAGRRTNTNSVALQRYVYTGAAPTTRTFGGTLTYSQFSTGTYPVGPGAGVNANLEIFTLPDSTIPVDPTGAANFNMLFGGFRDLAGYVSLGDATYADQTSVLNGSGSLSITLTLNPGDAIWVWAILQTPATNGGWVDASHTLVTAWDDPSSLVPATVAVPEPATPGSLLVGGLLVAAVVSRRRPQSQQPPATPM